jgi:proteasome lid subunit RPN8/RPN11/archaellum component FlaC
MAQKLDEYANEPLLIIKPKAYLTMLKHVLAYGNENLASSVEVMGICYGLVEGKNLVQYEAVPISHGGAIEVDFSPEDYAAFATVDEEMSQKGYFAIGWYHSHPGLEAFFSKVDIKNHLFYQKEQTPHAFGLVFDHTYFSRGEKNLALGFKAFRLNDFRKGMASDYHEIKYQVEVPDDLSYYREILKIIESIQTKKPFVTEARESMDGLGVWEESDAEGADEEGEKTKDPFDELREGYQEALQSFNNIFFNPLLSQFQTFTKDTESAALKGPKVMIGALSEMRDAIGNGLGRVKTFFEKAMEKEIAEVSQSIETTIKDYVKTTMELPKKADGVVEKISGGLSDILKDQLQGSMKGILDKMAQILAASESFVKKQSEFTGIIDKQGAAITDFSNNLKTNMDALNQSVGGLPKQVNAVISKRVDGFKGSMEDLKKNNAEIKTLIDELSKAVMSKRK